MTAKKYNKKHRVLDLDARDARRREKSVERSAIKAAAAVFALHEVRRRPHEMPRAASLTAVVAFAGSDSGSCAPRAVAARQGLARASRSPSGPRAAAPLPPL